MKLCLFSEFSKNIIVFFLQSIILNIEGREYCILCNLNLGGDKIEKII